MRLNGCQSVITRTVPAGATNDEIAAIANEMFAEWARQQAECDMPDVPGVTPNPPPGAMTISALSPTTTCVDVAYSASVTASEPCTFSTVGSLPPGLVLSQFVGGDTATISGTPTFIGTSVFGIHAVSGANTASIQVTFTVAGITTATALPDANEGSVYSQALTSSGLNGTLTWSAVGLPSGMSVNATTGVIEGTPDVGSAGNYTPTITVSNS